MGMEDAKNYIAKNDLLAKALGIEPVHIGPGYGKAIMQLDAKHKNSAGVAHGGAIFSLADVALALASNGNGYLALGLNSSISYLAPGKIGPLTAEAREVSMSHKVAHYEIKVTDGEGKLIAISQGITYRKNSVFPPLEENTEQHSHENRTGKAEACSSCN